MDYVTIIAFALAFAAYVGSAIRINQIQGRLRKLEVSYSLLCEDITAAKEK